MSSTVFITVIFNAMEKIFARCTPYLACFSAGLFSFFNLSQLTLFNVINPDLLSGFNLNSAQLGFFSASYLFANALGLIPAGILLDNYSLRRVGLFFMGMTVIATAILAESRSLPICVTMRIIQGLGSAMSLQISLRIVTMWFPHRLGFATGLIIAFALSGGIFGDRVFTVLMHSINWHETILVSALIGLSFFWIMFLFLVDKPLKDNSRNHINCLKLTKISLAKLPILSIGLYIGLMNLPIFIITGLWGNLFLHQAHGLTLTQSAVTTSLLFLGVIIGSPILGCFSDILNNRRFPMLIGAIFSLPAILIIIFNWSLSFLELKFLFFILGFFISAQVVGYAYIADHINLNIRSTITAIAALIENLIGGIGQIFFGYLLNLRWNHKLLNQVPFYSHSAYTIALFIFPMSFIICFAIIFKLNNQLVSR